MSMRSLPFLSVTSFDQAKHLLRLTHSSFVLAVVLFWLMPVTFSSFYLPLVYKWPQVKGTPLGRDCSTYTCGCLMYFLRQAPSQF